MSEEEYYKQYDIQKPDGSWTTVRAEIEAAYQRGLHDQLFEPNELHEAHRVGYHTGVTDLQEAAKKEITDTWYHPNIDSAATELLNKKP